MGIVGGLEDDESVVAAAPIDNGSKYLRMSDKTVIVVMSSILKLGSLAAGDYPLLVPENFHGCACDAPRLRQGASCSAQLARVMQEIVHLQPY